MSSLIFRIALKSERAFKSKAKGTSYLLRRKKRQEVRGKLLEVRLGAKNL